MKPKPMSRSPQVKRKVITIPMGRSQENNSNPALIKTKSFQCVSFFDPKQDRQVVILYSLGEDGILREYVGGKWHPYPVTE